MEKLPKEVLEEILKGSSLRTRFKLAIVSKKLYETVRHISLTIEYNINSKNGVESIGSFFYSSIIHVNVVIDNGFNYYNLKNMLNVFYCLQSIRINDLINEKSARRVIASLPMSPSTAELNLYCNSRVSLLLQNELRTTGKRTITIIDESQKKRKREATPPLIKQALYPLKAAYESSKAELYKIISIEPEADIKIPSPLSNDNFVKDLDYKKLTRKELEGLDFNEDISLDQLNKLATKLSEKLIESIVQFDTHWIYITEYEMYVRNCKYIDDCSQESYWITYPAELEVHQVKKNEKGNTWFEISMFWGRFEFLVTGGLRGNNSDSTITPFLGSAQKLLTPINIKSSPRTTYILVKKETPLITQTTRKLRQYNKQAAKQKWLYKSTKFVRKGFHTTVPLDVHKHSLKVNMASVASFLLSKIVVKEFKEEDKIHTLELLAGITIFSFVKKDTPLNILKKDCEKLKLVPAHQSITNCFFHLVEGNIDSLVNDNVLALFKGTLANYCKNEDEKKLKHNVHLL